MWDKCCRGNIGRDSGQVTCEVRGHIKRNSTTARPKIRTNMSPLITVMDCMYVCMYINKFTKYCRMYIHTCMSTLPHQHI